MIFKGSGVAIVTPFDEKGEVNYEKFEELVEFQIANGTKAIIVLGTTGEASTLEMEEKENLISIAVKKVNKRVPVIAGTGSNNTKKAIELSKKAESLGADGLLVITPYYNKTTQDGLYAHFKAVADSTHLPIIVYNVPSRTGLNCLPQTIKRLSGIDNVVAVKEASGNIVQIAEIASLIPDDFNIYSGNDDQIVPVISLGGMGVISVLANILPKETQQCAELFLNGNVEESRKLQLKYLPLIRMLFVETNPIPVKTAMNLMGFNVGGLRLPLVNMGQENKEKLKKLLEEYGLLK